MTFSPVSHASELPAGSRARTMTASTAPPNMYTHRRSVSYSPQVLRTPKSSTKPMSTHGVEPLTPPPSPPFNPIAAAAQCKAMDGYVSFANVGLDIPDGEDDEQSEEDTSAHRWLKWGFWE